MSNADEPPADPEPSESAPPVPAHGVLSQSLAEELLVVAVFACFAVWLFWWL